MSSSITAKSPKHWLRARQTPLSALALILVVLVCIGACSSVIIISNGQTVESWDIPPAVLLAVLSSVVNFSLGSALSLGVAINWWRSASRGTTLARLHLIWTQGLGFDFATAILRNGFLVRKVVLSAVVIGVIKFLNNPLLQRATTVQTLDVVTNDTIMLNLATHIPDGWAGTVRNYTDLDPTQSDSAPVPALLSTVSLLTMQRWWRNDTITSLSQPGYDCNGVCKGKVEGAGINYTCKSNMTALNLTAPDNNNSTLFMMDLTRHENSTYAPYLLYRAFYAADVSNSCIATMIFETCEIQSAIVRYPVIIQNTTVTLDYNGLQDMDVISIYVSNGDKSKPGPDYLPAGPLTALQFHFDIYMWSNSTLIDEPPGTSYYSGIGFPVDFFFESQQSSYGNNTVAWKKCALKWRRPTDYFLNAMQDYMFRAAINVGSGEFTGNNASRSALSVSSNRTQNFTEVQTFLVERTAQTLIFRSNCRYLVAAAAVITLALLAVVVLLWGLWELGRTVNLSPIETARAFGAPMMQRAGRSSMADGLLGEMREVEVRFDPGSGVIKPILEVSVEYGEEKK